MKGLLLGLLLLTPLAANAQGRHHESFQERRDDWRDTRRLERLLRDFDFAVRRHDFYRLRGLDRELNYLITSEIRETRYELRDDLRDVRRDRASRREVRDARIEARTLERVKELCAHADRLYGRLDPWSLSSKRSVIVELLDLSRREVYQENAWRPRGRRW
ncbi:MAG: hypothetical protein ACT4TC_09940 [Myxococcaceae bacterium]